MHDLGEALSQVGLVAAQALGSPSRRPRGGLAAFAKAGLIGSDAGTSLKTMLQRLQNPEPRGRATMKQLGINVYDANGDFVGLAASPASCKTATRT